MSAIASAFAIFPAARSPEFLRGPFFVAQPLMRRRLIVPGLPDRAIQRRLHHAGADRVHPHAMRGEILGHALGEVDVRGLRALYGGSVCEPICPATEATNTIVPPARSTMCGASACATWVMPMMFTSSTRGQSAGWRFVNGKPNLARADRRGMHEMIDAAERVARGSQAASTAA